MAEEIGQLANKFYVAASNEPTMGLHYIQDHVKATTDSLVQAEVSIS